MSDSLQALLEEPEFKKAEDYRRRRATAVLVIMFTDLMNSTALREQLGDAVFDDILSEHDATLVPLITRHDGTFLKHTGDGLLAVFDKPSAGVVCAVAMQEALRGHKVLQIRVGLDMGQVAVDEVAGIRREVFGRFVHRAARLQELAVPGHVLTTEQVQDSASGWISKEVILWHHHGVRAIRGVEKPLSLWEPFQATATGPQTMSAAATASARHERGLQANISAQTVASLIVESAKSVEGKLVGPYLLGELIGQGGSGAVFRARHAATGRLLCLKVMYPLNADVEKLARLAARAVRGIVTLNRRDIIGVYDWGEIVEPAARSLFIAMEHVDGGSLREWIGRAGATRSTRERLRMAIRIAEALDAAHTVTYLDEWGCEQQGVLHGDLKPENILVRQDDSPVITDFMMLDAQRLLDPGTQDKLRALGVAFHGDNLTGMIGTPGFMGPEQERDGIVTRRSDIFSLGVTLGMLFERAVNDSRPISEEGADIWAVISRMTRANPVERPSDVAEVVRLLRSCRVAQA